MFPKASWLAGKPALVRRKFPLELKQDVKSKEKKEAKRRGDSIDVFFQMLVWSEEKEVEKVGRKRP